MIKTKLQFPQLLVVFVVVVFCTLLPMSGVYSQQPTPMSVSATLAASGKQKLARDVLLELGIAQRYDLHFDHAVGILVSPTQNPKFLVWLREMLAREVGWKQAQADYIAQLVTDFSTTELKELLKLSKQPILKRVLRSEIEVYAKTASARHKLQNQVWENYNAGKINPPPDLSR